MVCKTHKIALILLVLILVAGCTHTHTLEMSYVLEYDTSTIPVNDSIDFKIDNTTPYQELITKTVDIHAFAQRYSPNGKRTIDDVMGKFGIECLRETEEGALYSIHKVLQGGLLYVFYNNYDWDIDISGNSILRWFYVRERLSSSDFYALTENVDTIDDVIQIDKTEQIFLNIYQADPMHWDEGIVCTTHYLEDGLLDIGYKLEDGKLVFTASILTENFDLRDMDEPVHHPYSARIFDADWVK